MRRAVTTSLKLMSIGIGTFALVFVGSVDLCGAQEEDRAKQRFMDGISLIESERYKEALEAFEESYRINPKLSVLFNIGMCQKAMSRYVDAIATFNKYLQGDREGGNAERRLDIRDAMLEMERMVGTLKLEDAPPDATVIIDEKKVALTPLEKSIIVDPGKHTLKIVKKAFYTQKTQIIIKDQTETVVKVDLVPTGIQTVVSTDDDELEQVFSSGEYRDKKKRLSPLFISGIVTGALSLGAVGVGAYYGAKRGNDFDKGVELAEEINNNGGRTDPENQDNVERYNKINRDKSADEIGIIVSFVSAGALLATAVVLIVVDAPWKEKETANSVSFTPTLGGVALQF
jgi:tetratricopeptide (TPR) repeat protein